MNGVNLGINLTLLWLVKELWYFPYPQWASQQEIPIRMDFSGLSGNKVRPISFRIGDKVNIKGSKGK